MARSSYGGGPGCRFVPREDVISYLTVIQLHDPEKDEGTIRPWPPPAGGVSPRAAAPAAAARVAAKPAGPAEAVEPAGIASPADSASLLGLASVAAPGTSVRRRPLFRPWPPPGGLPPGQDPLAGGPAFPSPSGAMLGLTADDPDEGFDASGSAGVSSQVSGAGSSGRGRRSGLSLNDEESLRVPLPPWPPRGGLAPEEDLFALNEAEAVEEAFTPRFLRPDGAKDIIGNITSTIDPGRAGAVSVVLHLILVLFMLLAPPSKPRTEVPLDQQPDPMGLIAMMKRAEPEPPIPVGFYPAPGPKAKAPGKAPLPSDVDRQAHGGDPKLPKAETPKAVSRPGIQELDPGRRGAPQKVAEARPRAGQPDGAQEPPPEESRRPDEQTQAVTQPSSSAVRRPLSGIPASAMQGLTADQVTKVQRDLGRGEGGDAGGGWDRDGGFVDQGPLSFDTAGYDWGNYAAEMIRRIKRNWEVPQLAYYGVKGKLTIRFFILKDGRVEGARILSNSGIPPYDNASLQAILRSNPFRPLPADLGKDREGVTITFLYNIRTDEYAGR